jgi:hypothetical protein
VRGGVRLNWQFSSRRITPVISRALDRDATCDQEIRRFGFADFIDRLLNWPTARNSPEPARSELIRNGPQVSATTVMITIFWGKLTI